MQKFLYFILCSFLLACSDKKTPKTITVGDYSFDFPNDFKLIKEKGIDSYVGKIKGDSMWLGFDYGYYSDPLVESPQEYLDKKFWLYQAAMRFMKVDITYDKNNLPNVELKSLRTATPTDTTKFKQADFIAVCNYDTLIFEYPIILPEKTKQHFFQIDTIQNHLRKIIIAKNPKEGITGIFLKNLKGFNQSINSYPALSMATSDLTKQQQNSVLKMFSTVRIIHKK